MANLSPEFSRAITLLIARFSSLPSPVTSLNSRLWNTDELHKIFSSEYTSKLPSHEGWKWKQSKGRAFVSLATLGVSVIVRKMIPRPHYTPTKAPSYKLWEFSVTPQNISEHPYLVYWCEKGTEKNSWHDLDLQDFIFLAEFMSPEVAKSLWPALFETKQICTTQTNSKADDSVNMSST